METVFNKRNEIILNVPVNVPDNVPENGKKTAKKRQDNGKKIIDVISTNSNISITELAGILGVSIKTIRTNIDKLKAIGILRRIGPDKGGHWEVLDTNSTN